jgi:hypothetical protein
MIPLAIWDAGLSDYLVWTFKVIAALGGAVIGWFVGGPVIRLLVRGAFHRPAGSGTVFFGKICGAGLVGTLFFFLVGLGGDFGFGRGGGGNGSGTGTGNGGNGSGEKKGNDSEDKKGDITPKLRPILEIELLGGDRYKDDERFFLLHRKEPALTLKEVEKYFQEHNDLEVHIVIRTAPEMSVSENSPTVIRLRKLADKYKLPNRIENVP